MKPAPFKYFVPETIEEAGNLLHEHGYDAKFHAGEIPGGIAEAFIDWAKSEKLSFWR